VLVPLAMMDVGLALMVVVEPEAGNWGPTFWTCSNDTVSTSCWIGKLPLSASR